MKIRKPLVVLALVGAVFAVRRLAAHSNTQVHRINQK
jgi:hypothetical protein